MKIALFSPNLMGAGGERVMVLLANGLVKRGMKIDLLLGKAAGEFLHSVDGDVNIIDLGKNRTIATLLPLVRYLRVEKPSVLISSISHSNIVALLASRCSRTSVRVIALEQMVYSHGKRGNPGLRARIVSKTTEWLYPWAGAIVAVSQGTAEDIIRFAGVPRQIVRCIYGPAVDSRIKDLAQKPISHPFFCKGAPPVILGVGGFNVNKDFPTLIRAFADVRKQRPCHLVILGQGPERGRLESLIQELGVEQEVSLPGFDNNPYAYMARSAVFALSSRSEALSLVLIEALFLGVPIVSTNCEWGPGEILQNGKYGRLVPVGDPQAMADAIQLALTEPPTIVPAEVLEPFMIDSAVDKYVSLISELTKK